MNTYGFNILWGAQVSWERPSKQRHIDDPSFSTEANIIDVRDPLPPSNDANGHFGHKDHEVTIVVKHPLDAPIDATLVVESAEAQKRVWELLRTQIGNTLDYALRHVREELDKQPHA